MVTDVRRLDPYSQTKDRYVMVKMAKSKRCTSRPHKGGFQCQLEKGHDGKHYFWKEIALMGWRGED